MMNLTPTRMISSAFCCFGWGPRRKETNNSLLQLVKEAENDPLELAPVLQEFQHLIETNGRIYMLFQSMFQQAGHGIKDYRQLLRVLNRIIRQGPPQTTSYFAGVPIMQVLEPAMRTVSGYAAFIDPEVNEMIKKLLNEWAVFLASPESTAVLDNSPQGWFNSEALRQLTATANVRGTTYAFEDIFVCDPTAPAYGYKSWDSFFTRELKHGIRPVAFPDDDSVIVNACESRPFAVTRSVKGQDVFWIKEQKYSVHDMVGGEVGERFVGGTIYQAYLDAYSYHRWHAPVSGRITQAYILPGTYYSSPIPIDPNPSDEVHVSYQHYLAAMATRAVIVIEADNPDIGEVAFLAVGMEEVSTCEISVKQGSRVEKGDQLGMFHYGGSSYCLLFEKDINVLGFPSMDSKENVPVCGQLGVVVGEKEAAALGCR